MKKLITEANIIEMLPAIYLLKPFSFKTYINNKLSKYIIPYTNRYLIIFLLLLHLKTIEPVVLKLNKTPITVEKNIARA